MSSAPPPPPPAAAAGRKRKLQDMATAASSAAPAASSSSAAGASKGTSASTYKPPMTTVAAQMMGAEWMAADLGPKPKAPRKPRAPKPKDKDSKGPTLEQERRRLGDVVASRTNYAQYAVEARTHCKVEIPWPTFVQLIMPHTSGIEPETFSEETPIIVARIKGSAAAGEVFGNTKIKTGTMYQSWSADLVDIIYRPSTKLADIWWTMS